LLDIVAGFNLPRGTTTDLSSVLNASLAALQSGNKIAARNQLMAFRLKVTALMNKSLSSSEAEVLLRLANEAMSLIG